MMVKKKKSLLLNKERNDLLSWLERQYFIKSGDSNELGIFISDLIVRIRRGDFKELKRE